MYRCMHIMCLFIKQKVNWNIKWYLEHSLIAVNLNYFKSISYFLFLTSKNKHEENENIVPKTDGILNDMDTPSVDNYSNCVTINQSNFWNMKSADTIVEFKSQSFVNSFIIKLVWNSNFAEDLSTGMDERKDSTGQIFYVHPFYKNTLRQEPIDSKFFLKSFDKMRRLQSKSLSDWIYFSHIVFYNKI